MRGFRRFLHLIAFRKVFGCWPIGDRQRLREVVLKEERRRFCLPIAIGFEQVWWRQYTEAIKLAEIFDLEVHP